MAGGNHQKSSSLRKTRWESSSTTTTTTTNKNNNNNHPIPTGPNPKPPTKPNPSPKPNKNPTSSPAQSQARPPGPPPPPAYGFHMLDRRTIILADGSVRSYFALPPDYQDFTPPPPPMDPTTAARFLPGPEFGGQRFPMSPEGFRDNRNSVGEKRKFGNGEDKDDFLRQMQRQQQQHFMNFGPPNGFPVGPGPGPGTSSPFRREIGEEMRAAKYMRVGGGGGESLMIHNKHLEVDQIALKKAFLQFVKLINENPALRKSFLEDGKQGRLQCLACSRFFFIISFVCFVLLNFLIALKLLLLLIAYGVTLWCTDVGISGIACSILVTH